MHYYREMKPSKYLKVKLFKLFYFSMGFFIRGIQRTLIVTPKKNLLDYVNTHAVEQSAQYAINNFSKAMIFDQKQDLWEYCVNRVPSLLTREGEIIDEFGVYKGASINFFAKRCPKAHVLGFDSFEGLEEDWYGFIMAKSSFSTAGKLPKVENNVELFKGWFEDTMSSCHDRLQEQQIKILHMDADTYKPTLFVLNSLSKNLKKGSIIIFDEYLGYPSWELHEFKAWREVVKSQDIKYQYIGYTDKQVAVEII